jgi:hypothetical protein
MPKCLGVHRSTIREIERTGSLYRLAQSAGEVLDILPGRPPGTRAPREGPFECLAFGFFARGSNESEIFSCTASLMGSAELFRLGPCRKILLLGLIDYNGSIEVHSSLLNVVLHDEPHINT